MLYLSFLNPGCTLLPGASQPSLPPPSTTGKRTRHELSPGIKNTESRSQSTTVDNTEQLCYPLSGCLNPIIWDHLGQDNLIQGSFWSYSHHCLGDHFHPNSCLQWGYSVQWVPFLPKTQRKPLLFLSWHFSNACLVDSQLPMCLHITTLVKGTSDFAFILQCTKLFLTFAPPSSSPRLMFTWFMDRRNIIFNQSAICGHLGHFQSFNSSVHIFVICHFSY